MLLERIKYGTRPEIDKDSTMLMLERKPRRLCLAVKSQSCCFSRVNAEGLLGKFSSKFPNTVDSIFRRETGLSLFKKDGPYGTTYSYFIFDEPTYQIVALFANKYYQRVFINDQLFVSMALGMLQEYKDGDDEPSHTIIGELERQAKYDGNEDAIRQLVAETADFIKTTPYYKDASCICAMPSSKGLPKTIAKQVAQSCEGLADMSDCLSFDNDKNEVKDLNGDQRWDVLERANLMVEENVKDHVVILLDDLYQSGISMQYATMKLLEAGAINVYGLALVKSLTNNQ